MIESHMTLWKRRPGGCRTATRGIAGAWLLVRLVNRSRARLLFVLRVITHGLILKALIRRRHLISYVGS